MSESSSGRCRRRITKPDTGCGSALLGRHLAQPYGHGFPADRSRRVQHHRTGVGLGLLHDRHRATENWKEYPPAVFVSPPIVLKDAAPIPQITVVRTSPNQPFALSNIKEDSLVSVSGQAVDIKIVYPDPLTAPLALRPEEIWWGNGSQRHFDQCTRLSLGSSW